MARLFRFQAPRLRRILRRFEPVVSSEDVAQDSFVRLWAAQPKQLASPTDYLFRTALNLAADYARRRKRSPVVDPGYVDLDTSGAISPSPEDHRIASETSMAVRAALAALSENRRVALIRHKVEGCSQQEIADELGLSVRQVQRLIAQAIARCQAYLREQDILGPDR